MDFVVGLPVCQCFDAIWEVVDRLSKKRHFIARHMTINDVGLAKLTLWEVVCLHGLPVMIVSDCGPQFASTFWGQICSQLGIDRWMWAAFLPQTDGQTERVNASMEQYLPVFGNHQQDDLVQWLPLAELAVNNGTSESTKCTQFSAEEGVDPQMTFAAESTQEQDQWPLDADQVQAMMQQIYENLCVEMRWS